MMSEQQISDGAEKKKTNDQLSYLILLSIKNYFSDERDFVFKSFLMGSFVIKSVCMDSFMGTNAS